MEKILFGGVVPIKRLSRLTGVPFKRRLLYIYVYMYRIDWRNWKTPRADFLHVGIFLAWLGQFRVFEKIHTFDGVMT